jgi:hypothetical protein
MVEMIKINELYVLEFDVLDILTFKSQKSEK